MPLDTTSATAPDHGPAEPWLTCVGPLALFLVAGALEPTPSGGLLASLGIPYAAYPAIYALRIASTLALLGRVWPHIRAWVGRPTWWPPLLGLLLVVPWVVLAKLQHDAGWTFGAAERAGYNPFLPEHLGPDSPWAWAFLVVRGLGLVVIVPIIEELFVRGFLMRYVIKEQFWEVPFATLTAASAGACMAYAVASHPGEAIAAAGWFAVVSGIAAATRKPIDCILCHAATNLALGAYVLATGEWWLV
ncbi:MAG: CAAX prenyl protease-related protein [Planctomycetota bacterium]